MFINSVTANAADSEANALFTFPNGSVIAGQGNILTVLQDHMGNDEGPFGNIEGPNRECSSWVQDSLTYEDDFATQKNRLVVFADSSSLGASESSQLGRSKASSEVTKGPSIYPPRLVLRTNTLVYCSFPDRVRGILNEGALYGERKG